MSCVPTPTNGHRTPVGDQCARANGRDTETKDGRRRDGRHLMAIRIVAAPCMQLRQATHGNVNVAVAAVTQGAANEAANTRLTPTSLHNAQLRTHRRQHVSERLSPSLDKRAHRPS